MFASIIHGSPLTLRNSGSVLRRICLIVCIVFSVGNGLTQVESFSISGYQFHGESSLQLPRYSKRSRAQKVLFSSSSPSHNIAYKSFDEMASMMKRLSKIDSTGPDILKEFYEHHLESFSVKPGNADRLSVTSTCYSLLAMETSSAYDTIISDGPQYGEMKDKESKIVVANILKALLSSEWRQDDLFQVPVLLYTILRIDKERSMLFDVVSKNEQVASRIRKLVEGVLKARPKRRAGDSQGYSDYIIFQVCQVLSLLAESTPRPEQPRSTGDAETDPSSLSMGEPKVGGLPSNAVPEGATAEVSLGLARCAEVSSNELCRQLAYRSAGDSTSFDVIRLAYSLLTYVQSTNSLRGVAGRELVPGMGVAPGTKIAPLNKMLVTAALDAFFSEQNVNDGLWEQGQPIYQSFRRQGRSVGNAFVFAVDTVGSLLHILPSEYFRPHLQALERTLQWVERHERLEVIADYCDPESGECYGKALKGWSSPHLRLDTGPQAWSTAQVLACVGLMKTTVRDLMHKDVLSEFGGIAYSEEGKRPESWDRLLDTDLGTAVQNRTIKSVLDERVLTPFSDSIDSPSFGAAYSAILHGPPGTAKTTICEAMARKMGFDFVVIDTTAFLADGLTNVASRIRYVFSRLLALRECVILFDEIEEFMLNRENSSISMESRMLTTSMLTAINDLRRTKQSVFFVATNRLRAFDSAITRPGRFDMQLFVGTPNLEARVIQFRNALPSQTESCRNAVIDEYRGFLEKVWFDDAMYMNYLEGLQFASACAALVSKHPDFKLDYEQMASIFDRQAAVMTVRGPARDEYLAAMKLSRV